jgi:hypothetical protein
MSAFSRLRMCNLDALLGPGAFDGQCEVPPPGWWCSREAGHDGPCAAYPWRDDPRLPAPSTLGDHTREEQDR